MTTTPKTKDPFALSYAALRRVVGYVAVALPFLVSVPVYFFCDRGHAGSISGYYYYPTRNVFVGGLCAISAFMISNRGYDRRDEVAGIFSAACALGVAFFPTSPEICATDLQRKISYIHLGFATALFLTLAYFCLSLFQKTGANGDKTAKKELRNKIYSGCGLAILASLAAILASHLFDPPAILGVFPWPLLFETTSLLAFGFAWLVKGEALFRDENPSLLKRTKGSNRIFTLARRPATSPTEST